MLTSRKFASILLALSALVLMSSAALAADPGLVYPPTSEVSDQKAGSVLIYNFYSSGATSGNSENTRINITNTSSSNPALVHLFFVANSCSIADSYICLTENQTASFLTSDVDPGVSGYIVAIAVDDNGCPYAHNFLIGDEYVKLSSGHAANLGAEALSALYAGSMPGCDNTSTVANVVFNGVFGGYNQVPRVLALSNIPSRADGNDTLVVINRIAGNLATGAATLGTLFGLLYDDAENVLSFSVNGGCQLRNSLSNTFPRTAPRFETFIPAGRSGWAKVYSQSAIGILGAMINLNANAGAQANAFNGGHNLHKLTLNSGDTYTIPVFPPSC
ncbi:MAG: hypothetical protein JNJ50_28500 [Acidobacteria bacterium]|nr:hypothetical protein [Acidobacteriota bacterium]